MRPTTGARRALWIPRVLLFPLHATTEYLFRWPASQLAYVAERYELIARTRDALSWDDGDGRVLPIIKFNSGFSPSLGAGVSWQGFPVERTAVSARLRGDLRGRNVNGDVDFGYKPNDSLALAWQVAGRFRSDTLYAGSGIQTDTRVSGRYERRNIRGAMIFRSQLSRMRMLRLPSAEGALGVQHYKTGCAERRGSDDICGPDGVSRTDDDLLPLQGAPEMRLFGRAYNLGFVGGRLAWDSRRQRPASPQGGQVVVTSRVAHGLGAHNTVARFVRYGAQLAGFVALFPHSQHMLGLRGRVELADPIRGGVVPFEELPSLGGLQTMRGFSPGRFHGRSTATATLAYRYPVWALFDAEWFFEVGNAYGAHFAGFAFDTLLSSMGFSLRRWDTRLTSFNLTLGVGSSPLGRGDYSIERVTLAFGTTRGF